MSHSEEPCDLIKDSSRSWYLAVAEIRRKGLREGKFEPRNDEERVYVAEKGAKS
ncbi:MAG: hypothetical protein ABJA10_02780 [Aestuariivirga sp.]